MVKAVVIADTHIPASGNELPDVLIEQLKKTDLIIHAGDLTELKVLDELKGFVRTEAVVGNMDSFKVRRTLPEKRILDVGNFRIGVIHGVGRPDNLINYARQRFVGEKLDCIIYGHSHRPSIDRLENIIYFNPGSPTDKVFAPYNSFGILEIGEKLVPRIIRL